jgi:hypothetical protein
MHRLSRQIRFAVNPFGDSTAGGTNSYCAKPAAEGLALFFALWVELKGNIDEDTGFVVNVADIDGIVRNKAVGIFGEFIKNCLAVAGTCRVETKWRRTATNF